MIDNRVTAVHRFGRCGQSGYRHARSAMPSAETMHLWGGFYRNAIRRSYSAVPFPLFVPFEFAVVLLKVRGVLVVIRLVEWRDVERKVSVVALEFVGTFLQSLVFFLPSFVLHRTTIRPNLRWLDMAG